jgi:hypothetical protein
MSPSVVVNLSLDSSAFGRTSRSGSMGWLGSGSVSFVVVPSEGGGEISRSALACLFAAFVVRILSCSLQIPSLCLAYAASSFASVAFLSHLFKWVREVPFHRRHLSFSLSRGRAGWRVLGGVR